MQNFSMFSLCMDGKVDKRNSESNVNVNSKRFNANEFFRSFSRTNLCITQQDLYKYSRQCQDYFRSNCMCCNGKVTPEKLIQAKEVNGTPVIPINLSPDVHIKNEDATFTRVQQISTVSSPSIDRTNSTMLTSTGDPDDNIVYEYSNAGELISNDIQTDSRFSAHSKSSSKKSIDDSNIHFGGHSYSPSRKSLDDNVQDSSSQVTIVAVDEKIANASSTSRPISVSSVATTKSLYDDYELRPATSLTLAKSNASSASATSRDKDNRSRTSFLGDESDRPISLNSRSTSVARDIDKASDLNSDEEQSVDLNRENEPVNLVAQEEEHLDVDHLQNDGPDETGPDEIVPVTETEGNVAITETNPQPISSDNESSCTADAIDEVDYIKERIDEQTNTTTVPSVQHFSVRPSIRFKKRKVSPTKPATQTNSRQKMKDQHATCLQQLDSSNWDQIMLGLQSFVCLMRNNPEQIEPQLHQYCLALSKNIKNLRSQVSRASCQAAGEFFESHSKLLEQEADDLALALLNRTADTNKFLRSDATKALKIMCETLPLSKVIQIVTTKGATHQNAVVRTASANLCNQIIERCGVDKIFSMNRDLRDKLILTGANLLLEGSLDTRNYAKTFFKQLSYHPAYHKTIQDVIPPRTFRNIEKTLKNIK